MRIFVAADNPVLVDAFVDRYGARVLSHPCGRPTESTHTVVSTNEETLIAAFVEMLCLSRGVIFNRKLYKHFYRMRLVVRGCEAARCNPLRRLGGLASACGHGFSVLYLEAALATILARSS